MKTDKVRVGIVGLGLAATPHYKGYASHPSAEVVAVCDLDEKHARQYAGKYSIPEVYTSYAEMLRKAPINTVDIATPTYLHTPMALQAVEAGLHVHCEKPFCRTMSDGMEVSQAVQERGTKLVVGETYVFISSHMKARELIEAGEIGRPLQIRERHGAWLERSQPAIPTGPEDRQWRMDPEKSGGGRYPWIYDHAVHFFATAEYFMPGTKINEVYSVVSRSGRSTRKSGAAHDPYMTPEVDIPIITWKYDDPECQGVWMRAERLNGKYDFMRGFHTSIIGDKGMIEVIGEGGHNLIWDGKQQHLVLHRQGKDSIAFRFDEGGDDVWQSDISYYSQGHIHQVQHLIDCILQDTKPRYSAEDGTHAVQCTLAVILSAEQKCPIRLDQVDPGFSAWRG
jgi:predicted dehydrogenase